MVYYNVLWWTPDVMHTMAWHVRPEKVFRFQFYLQLHTPKCSVHPRIGAVAVHATTQGLECAGHKMI